MGVILTIPGSGRSLCDDVSAFQKLLQGDRVVGDLLESPIGRFYECCSSRCLCFVVVVVLVSRLSGFLRK